MSLSGILIATIGGAIGSLVLGFKLYRVRGEMYAERRRADAAVRDKAAVEEQLENVTRSLEQAATRGREERGRLEDVVADLHQEIAELSELITRCNDPAAVRLRLERLGDVIDILK